MTMAKSSRMKLLSALLMTATALAGGVPRVAAQTAPTARNFDIPAQSLREALLVFAQQSNVQVTASDSLVAGRVSAAVSGDLAPAEALSRLLEGTGLTFRFDRQDAVRLEPAPQVADGTVQLGTLRVEGGGQGGGTGTGDGRGTGEGGGPAMQPYRTPGSSAYIDREAIERFRGTSPSDIFQGTPGVISGEARNSGGIDVNIRGLQGYNRTAITIDGAQQTSSIDRGYFGDANRTFIDPDLLSSVTITKGPSNSASASGAIAGEVAMRTLAADDIVRAGRSFGIRLRLGTSTNNASPPPVGTMGGVGTIGGNVITKTNRPDQVVGTPNFPVTPATGRPDWLDPHGWNGSLALAAKSDALELVAAIARRETGNYFAGTRGNHAQVGRWFVSDSAVAASATVINRFNTLYPGHGFNVGDLLTLTRETWGNVGSTFYRAGEEVLNTSNTMTSGLLKGTAKFGDGHRLELGYSRSVSQFGYQFPSSIKFATDSLISQLELAEADVEMATARYSYDPGSDLVDLSLNLWLTGQTIEETMRTRGSSEVRYLDNYSRVGGFDLSNRSIIGGVPGELSLRYGVAFLDQKMRLRADSQWIYSGVMLLNDISQTISRRRQIDLFASIDWAPTDWLKIEAGLRHISTRTKSDWLLLSSITSPYPAELAGSEQSASGLAPSAGITVEPLAGLQLYGTYREGWRAPSFTEVGDFTAGATPYAGAAGPANAGRLQNERSKNVELGVNYLATGLLGTQDSLGIKVNYFNSRVDNYAMLMLMSFPLELPDGTIINASGASTVSYDRALFSGFEGSLRYDAGIVFAEAAATYYDRVRFCLTKTLCRNWDLAPGIVTNAWRNHTPPEYSLSGTAGVRLFDKRLELVGRVSHTAGAKSKALFTYLSTTNYIANLSWDAYTLVDLSASLRVNDAVAVSLSAENLLDEYHIDPLAMAMQPAPGRTLRLSATFNF